MSALGAHLLTSFLAAPAIPDGKGAEWGKAAPIGMLILVLLGIALYLLIKSMNRHMRKVNGLTSFEEQTPVAVRSDIGQPKDDVAAAPEDSGAGTTSAK